MSRTPKAYVSSQRKSFYIADGSLATYLDANYTFLLLLFLLKVLDYIISTH